MKTNLLLFSIVLFFFSCNTQESLLDDPLEPESTLRSSESLRQNVSFDWENINKISLFNFSQEVILPWYNGAEAQIPYYITSDYQKKNGWMMVYNFCTDPEEYQEGKYYLMFYNKLTGLLRVFYYLKERPQAGSVTFWQVRLSEVSKLLNTAGHFTLPLTSSGASESYVTNISSTESKSLTLGWNCFDIEFTYDPDASTKRQLFSIGLYDKNVGDISLLGDVNLKSEGTIVSTSSSNPVTDIINSAATVVADSAKSYVNNQLTAKKILPSLAASAVSAIVSGGVSAMITSGVNLVFGSFLGIGGSSSKTVQDLSFKTTGSVNISGSITSVIPSAGKPIQNLLFPGSLTVIGDRLLPIYTSPLGVWNIEKSPIIIIDKVAWEHTGGNGYNGVYSYSQAMYIESGSVKVELNPETQTMINSYNVDSEIIYYEKFNGSTNWNSDSYSEFGIDKGVLLYKDDSNVFYRYPKISYTSGAAPTYKPSMDPTVITCEAHSITTGRVKHNFVVKVTLTLYPKPEYGTQPITLTRSYIPQYKIIQGQSCL